MTAQRTTLPRLTDRLPLGAAGLQVSPACLGMVRDPNTVLAAYDAGINFFFVTADMHWPLYAGLRKGLTQLLARGGDIRDRIVLAAVAYPTQPEFCVAPFQELVEEMKLDRLDLLIAGGAYGHEVLERLQVFHRHRADRFLGTKAIGVTFHDRMAAGLVLSHGLCDIGFIRYNPAHPGARWDLFPALAERPKTALVFNFKSAIGVLRDEQLDALGLEPDFWRPRMQDAYRFALSRPELDGVLCAPQSPREVEELAAALEEGPLDPDEQDSMISLCAEYKEQLRAQSA